jgi:hypothetical protein
MEVLQWVKMEKAYLYYPVPNNSTGLGIRLDFILKVNCSPVNPGVGRLPLVKFAHLAPSIQGEGK